jgi:hypothetical protein
VAINHNTLQKKVLTSVIYDNITTCNKKCFTKRFIDFGRVKGRMLVQKSFSAKKKIFNRHSQKAKD